MGLFNRLIGESHSDEDKQEINTFEPIIIDIQDVANELKTVASVNGVSPKFVDFNLLEVSTRYKLKDEPEWTELKEGQLEIFDDDAFFLNPDLAIEQHFKIEIFDTRSQPETIALPKLTLGANKNLTRVVATVKKGFDIRYSSDFEERFIEAINKKKVRAKILVGIREATMQREVKRISSLIRINNAITEDITFIVMQGIEPVAPVDDNFIEHYKKKIKSEDPNGRVDYSRRGYLQSVSEGEIVLEYIKPQEGSAGKTCRGVYIGVREPKVLHEQDIKVSENIIKKEDDKSIRYIAKCSGYVKNDGNTYDIQEEMEIREINFKTTGSIETGIDQNVKINIKESDALKDAIGTGMSVESTELNMEGNVGAQATIRAKTVAIGGQTHKTSTIWAQKASITVHRGSIEAQEVKIKRLEGGHVNGDVVHVESMIGGEIVAREIHIDSLFSNASITATQLIEIKNLKGSNNKLIIDPASTGVFEEESEKLKDKIEQTRKLLEKLPKQLENKKILIEKNKRPIEMVKEKIAELKEEGTKPPATFMAKLRDYQQLVNEYNLLLKNLKDTKFQLNDFKEELNNLQSKIFAAKIINHSPWKEYNEIKFRLISPAIEIQHATKENEMSKVITLIESADGGYKINLSNEYVK